MKRNWKRFLSLVLVLVMTFTLLPAPVMAAISDLLGNGAVANAALLQALKDQYGEDAETYLALLESYGLLDEDGNLITNETINVNGVEYTLDELEELLSDPDVDLSTVAEVDGVHVTLEELKLVLEIEQYLAYVQATYFTQQELTGEQIASFYDLADAWASGAVTFSDGDQGGTSLLTTNDADGVGPSGVNHSTLINVAGLSGGDLSNDNRTATFYMALESDIPREPLGVDATMSFRPLPGIADVGDVWMVYGNTGEGERIPLEPDGKGGYRLTFPADQFAIRIYFELTIPDEVEFIANDDIYGLFRCEVQVYDLENALFDIVRNPTRYNTHIQLGGFYGSSVYKKTFTTSLGSTGTDYTQTLFTIESPETNETLEEWGIYSFGNQPTETFFHQLSRSWTVNEQALASDADGYAYEINVGPVTVERSPFELTAPHDNASHTFWELFNPNSWGYRATATINPQIRAAAGFGSDRELADSSLFYFVDSDNTVSAEVDFVHGEEYTSVDSAENPDSQNGMLTLYAYTDQENGEDLEVDIQSTIGWYQLEYNGNNSTKTNPINLYFMPRIDGGAIGSETLTITATGRTREVNVTSVTVPAGTYYPGQSIPIRVELDYPVLASQVQLVVNGVEAAKITDYMDSMDYYTNVLAYTYTVPEVAVPTLTLTSIAGTGTDANREGVVEGANGEMLEFNTDDISEQIGQTFNGVVLTEIDTEKAFDFDNVALARSTAADNSNLLTITVPANRTNDAYIEWVLNAMDGGNTLDNVLKATLSVPNSTTPATVASFTAVMDEETGTELEAVQATVNLGYNLGTDSFTGLVEFSLIEGEEERLLMGTLKEYTLAAAVPVAGDDMLPTLTVDGETYDAAGTADTPVTLYAGGSNSGITMGFSLAGSGYTWGDTAKVGYYDANGVLQSSDPTGLPITDLHFAWQSSAPDIAYVSVDSGGNAALNVTGAASGPVEITLVAFNGGVDEADGTVSGLADTESAPIRLNVEVGQDPYLTIPEGQVISIREGSDAVVNWSSNLCAKNAAVVDENGEVTKPFAPTTFTVNVYAGRLEEAQLATAEPVWSGELTTGEDNPTISSVTLSWDDLLEGLYDGTAEGLNGEEVRAVTVTVSAQYDGRTYGTYYDSEAGEWVHNATAVVSMVSQPAAVTLHEPAGGLYQTDDVGQITLNWDISSLDTTETGGGQFELYVASTNPGFGTNGVLSVTDVTVGSGGTYTLAIPSVVLTDSPTSYRDAYTITIKAKNNAETNWSSSSYVLYVYSRNALDILVDGASAGSVTMDNEPWIAQLWAEGGSEAIVALQRDIALKNVVSINYGQYAWAELADQIQWNSTDSSVASVNYKQGGLYENIKNFSYTSYRPATDFVLSGLSNGSTTVTAEHLRTGISDSLQVTVETLRDKLYLFQCYPLNTVTTLTYDEYTDESRTQTERRTVQTNTQGEAAVYAPYGIAGDVYCQSTTTEGDETITWMGTFYHSDLVSSEADSTKLQLYPVNTMQLRRAAQVDLYIKTPSGTPYTGAITFRGGVYRQGEYCIGSGTESESGVTFTLEGATTSELQPGYVDQTVTVGSDGHLRVTMDISQFTTETLTEDMLAGERVYYLFQLEVPSPDSFRYLYYPVLLRVDGTLNTKDVLATGDSIVILEANENEDQARGPYISSQTLQYNSSAAASQVSVRKSTGFVGPSTTFPNAWITTTVTWWGDSEADSNRNANVLTLRDANGKVLPGQTSEKITYPFLDEAFTENVLTLNEDNMETWGVACYQNRGADLQLSRNGTDVDLTLRLPFRIVNMIGAEQAEESNVLGDTMSELKAAGNVDAKDAAGAEHSLSGTDKLIQKGMELVAGDAEYNTEQDNIAVRLVATSDPTVFRAFFCINAGNMNSGEDVTGIYPDYVNTETMVFADTGESDFDKAPSAMNVYHMAKGTYLDSVIDEAMQSISGQGERSFNFTMGGYFEADIYYDTDKGGWSCKPITGGIHAGGGLNYSWNVNTLVGPVPVNVSLTLGGTLELSLDVQRGTYYNVTDSNAAMDLTNAVTSSNDDSFNNALATAPYTTETAMDYLVALRVYLYMRVFAGVGFDLSVLAFKIGVFGQLGADLNFRWLKRNYLGAEDDGSYNFSAVGPVDSRLDETMDGQAPAFSGATGIEFVFKFLFISYEKVLCSVGFNVASQYGDWDTIEDIWAANMTINNQPVTQMRLANGQAMYAIDLGAQMESRDYVDLEDQRWVPASNSLILDDDSPLPDVLQEGAYSYANPVLSGDGNILMYLSDRGTGEYADPEDITNTRVAASVNNGGFMPGTRLETTSGGVNTNNVPDGYGDSALRLAGDQGFAVAAWVRQMDDITPDELSGGSTQLTDGQQMLQFNSTEIVVGIYQNGGWTLHQLTDNYAPDLAPVVATNGTRTIVAWREVNSTDVDGITSFDQQDAIRYAIYENGAWSQVQTLYDGGTAVEGESRSPASVKGIEAAMLSDGTAAVVYTLDTGADPDGSTDWETVAAIVPNAADTGDRASEDAVRTFQLTTNTDLDENPQVAAVTFEDTTQRFVIAWHTQRAVTADENGTESDIRLAAMDKSGALYNAMPESLGRSVEGTDDTVGSSFRFAKNAANIEDLAILWVDSVEADSADSGSYDDLGSAVSSAYSSYMGHDVLKAVKFVKLDNTYTVSGAVEVASMQTDDGAKNWTIDAFDAYVQGDTVHSVILGTNYDGSTQKEVVVAGGDNLEGTAATITVPVPVSRMFTAAEPFQNQIDLSAVVLAYDELYPNSKIDVQFTVRNSGMDELTGLTITAGGETVYTNNQLDIAPNRDVTLTAQFPTGSEIENTGYTITAAFASGNSATYTDTLYLDIPDVGISSVTVVQEEDGQRVLNYSLYNYLSPKLADPGDGWRVKVGFYADQSCTQPLAVTGSSYLRSETVDGVTQSVIVIDGIDGLELIDAGGFSDQVTFDVAAYVGEGQEIPEVGIPVYVKAWIEQDTTSANAPERARALSRANATTYSEVTEYFDGNNATSLILDNLSVRRDETVTITSRLDNTSGASVVAVDLQYNKLTGTQTGNLVVTLLDANGNPLERLQSYDSSGGLLTLTKEQRETITFSFTQSGAAVQVDFTELVLNQNSTELALVSLTGAAVEYDPETKTYTAAGTDLTSGILTILPSDPNAAITVDGQAYDVDNPASIYLPYGTTEWTIVVTNGGNSATYYLVLNNTNLSGGEDIPSIEVPAYSVVVSETEHGAVTANPSRAAQGQTVTITATPDEGFRVDSVTVTTGSGQSIAVRQTGSNTYTFTMPGGTVYVAVQFGEEESGWTNPFLDVEPGVWYYDAVRYVCENGLMNGTSANTFEPQTATSRAMVATILWRLEGSPVVNYLMDFDDVAEGIWYTEAIRWAASEGIVTGYGDGSFGPADSVTREQLATILYRYAGYKGYPVTAGADLSGYEDEAQISAWARTAMEWANAAGIINGTSATTLNPKGTASRAEVAAMLQRFCQQNQ